MPSPEPAYSFTIPSIHDDIVLCCRIYHPPVLSNPQLRRTRDKKEWRRKGIVMAHPYAPMGGTYDDRVVGIVVEEFLERGFVVGTFNFRGAHGSKTRTSWSGKSEVDDYTSFAAFFIHYLSYLHPLPAPFTTFTPDVSLVKGPTQIQFQHRCSPIKEPIAVILGGYSYGSLIVRNLPPIPSILTSFSAPISGSAASEILLRAHRLADQSNLTWTNAARDHAKQIRERGSLGVVMGGEETSPEKRRSSREIRRRSADGSRESGGGRKSLDIGSRIWSLSHRRSLRHIEHYISSTDPSMAEKSTALTITIPEVKYLLISPLTPPISTFVAPGLGQKFWSREKDESEIVGKHIALAIFGNQDIFTSARRTREWAEKMGNMSSSRFDYKEVEGAGHFWHEVGVEEKLRSILREWVA